MNINDPPNPHVCLEIGDIERGDHEADPLLGHGSLRPRPGDIGSPPEADPLLGHGPLCPRPGDIGSPEDEHSPGQPNADGQLPTYTTTEERQLRSYKEGRGKLNLVLKKYMVLHNPSSARINSTLPTFSSKGKLNTRLLTAIDEKNGAERLQIMQTLIDKGADPNATCCNGKLSACHLAALADWRVLTLLIKNKAKKCRVDDLGRTPLHMAALAGNVSNIALLLDIPKATVDRIENDNISSENLKKYFERNGDLVETYLKNSGETTLLDTWMDHQDLRDKRMDWTIPLYLDLSENWTPLNGAAAHMHKQSVRLLLAAGADPNLCDGKGRTALDVVGSAKGDTTNFCDVIALILNAGGQYNTMKEGGVNEVRTPLHAAVEFNNKEVIEKLLKKGAYVGCWDEQGRTPLHVCVQLKRVDFLKIMVVKAPDAQDRDGRTVLRAAVDAGWRAGVLAALDAGADATIQGSDGETPVHVAAMIGDDSNSLYDLVLSDISYTSGWEQFVNCPNNNGETALFNSVNSSHIIRIDQLLTAGATIKHSTTENNLNVFHVAAKNGNENVLKKLLDFDVDSTKLMINSLTKLEGYGPIHFAVSKNNISCVKLLIEKNADVCLRTSSAHGSLSPLHIAAVNGNAKIAECILSFGATRNTGSRPIDQADGKGWFPLHHAIHNDSKEVIKLLLKIEPNLAAQVPKGTDGSEMSETNVDMIMHNVSKPKEFIKNIFDSYISLDRKMKRLEIDYQILMTDRDRTKQMNVIQALLKTGNDHDQETLLLHPLAESYINLEWQAKMQYYILITAIYTCFAVSLSGFATSVFFNKDTYQTKPEWANLMAVGWVVYFFVLLTILVELLINKCFLKRENWVELGSILSAIILPPTIMVQEEAARFVATISLFLTCAHFLIIISQFPNWGYNVEIFAKVALNVIKILGTFVILLFAFAFSFMIQFRSQAPFDGPYNAFVKTFFFLGSEFGYDDLFDAEHAKDLGFAFQVVRVVFVAFLVLIPIALMNMVVSLACDDLADLKLRGKIRSLKKQVAFVSSIGALLNVDLKQTVLSFLPVRYCRQLFSSENHLETDTAKLKNKYNIQEVPKRFWNDFYTIAQNQKEVTQ